MVKKAALVLISFIALVLATCQGGDQKPASQPASAAVPAVPAAARGIVEDASGDVDLVRDGARSKLAAGDELRAGDSIEVGAKSSCSITIEGVGAVKLRSGTTAALTSLGEPGKIARVALAKGELLASVKKLGRRDGFMVTTQSVAMGVRGTRFLVSCASDGKTTVAVSEGAVAVYPARLLSSGAYDPDASQETAVPVESFPLVEAGKQCEVREADFAALLPEIDAAAKGNFTLADFDKALRGVKVKLDGIDPARNKDLRAMPDPNEALPPAPDVSIPISAPPPAALPAGAPAQAAKAPAAIAASAAGVTLRGYCRYAGSPLNSRIADSPQGFMVSLSDEGRCIFSTWNGYNEAGIGYSYDAATSGYSFTNLPAKKVDVMIYFQNVGDFSALAGNYTVWQTIDLRRATPGATVSVDLAMTLRIRLLQPVDTAVKQPKSPYLAFSGPVAVEWEPIPEATLYYWYLRVVTENEPWTVFDTAMEGKTVKPEIVLTGLAPSEPGRSYELQLYACDAAGNTIGVLGVPFEDYTETYGGLVFKVP